MAARYRRTISATVAHRRATSPRAPISRWKMAENVYWLVTLNIPRAAIAMCTSIGSRSARKLPSACPRAITVPSMSTIGRLTVRSAGERFMCAPLVWFSATTSRTKYSCAT